MRKIIITLASAALIFAGCNQKKKESGSEESKVVLSAEQEANKASFTAMLSEGISPQMSAQDKASLEKVYANYAYELAVANVSYETVQTLMQDFYTIEAISPLDYVQFVVDARNEGKLDDAVYFAVVYGKVYLHQALMAEKSSEEADASSVAALTEIVNAVDKEGNTLSSNLYSVVDKVVLAASKATAVNTLTAIGTVMGAVQTGEKLPVTDYKSVVTALGEIVKTLVPVRANVKYLANFAKATFVGIGAKVKEVKPFANIIDAINVNMFIDPLFDTVDKVGNKLGKLSDAYYANLNNAKNPLQSYVYAALGLYEELDLKPSMTVEEYRTTTESMMALLKQIELIDVAESEDPEATEYIGIWALSNPKYLSGMVHYYEYFLHLYSLKLNSVNAKAVYDLLGAVNFNLKTGPLSKEVDDVEKIEEDYIANSYIVENYNIAKKNGEGSGTAGGSGLLKIESSANGYAFYYVKWSMSYTVNDYVDHFHLDYTVTVVTCDALQPIVDYVYTVVAEIADTRTLTDELVSELLPSLFDLLDVAIDVLYRLIPGIMNEEEKGMHEVEEGEPKLSTQLTSMKTMLVNLKQFLSTASNVASVQGLVNHIFVALKSALSSFVDVGGKKKDCDLVAYVIESMTSEEPGSLEGLQEAKFAPIKVVLEDVYNIATSVGMMDMLIAALAEEEMVEKDAKFEKAKDFVDYFYGMISYFLGFELAA